MHSKVHKRGPVAPQMNITPLIDVVFLLIIFFMLANKIVSEENVPMIVPKLANPKTYDMGEAKTIVVNIAPAATTSTNRNFSQPLDFDGEPQYVSIGLGQRLDVRDLDQITKALEAAKALNSEVEVLLRADAALYFDAVQPVMNAITAANISKINLVAFLPDQGPVVGPQE
jgi:biopolymer transport protein TolR